MPLNERGYAKHASIVSVGVDGHRQTFTASSNSDAGDHFLAVWVRASERINERSRLVRKAATLADAKHVISLDGWLLWATKDRDCARRRPGQPVKPMPDYATATLVHCCPAEVGDLLAVTQESGERAWFTLYRVTGTPTSFFSEEGKNVVLAHQCPTREVDLPRGASR